MWNSKPSKTLQTSKHLPNRHPRAKATSESGTPGPRPQQWLSIGFQSCRLPARKHSKPSKTLQTLQTLSPTGTAAGPRPLLNQAPQGKGHSPPNPPKPSKPSTHLPQQAPQGQGHSNGFLLAFKAAVCQAAPKPSKTLQTLQTLPNPPNTIPNRHPRAKATAMAFYWLSKLPFASPQTLQTLQNPPNPPNTFPGQGHF